MHMQGKIVKGISGFYYVHVVESGIYECKAKGIFRQQKMKPLVGDDVEIDIISEEKKTGNVAAILPRKNALIRPAVATEVDTTLVPVVPSSLVYVQSTSRVPLLIFLILSTFTEPGVVPSKVVVQRVLPSEPFSVTVPPV